MLRARTIASACLPSAEKETFSMRSESMASRKVDMAHGVERTSAALAACDVATRPARPEARAPSCARRAEADMVGTTGAAIFVVM